MAPAVKRMIGHLFLVWLAANLKHIPAFPLRIAGKPPPRRPLVRHSTATLPAALTALSAAMAALVRQREHLCPTRALLCARRRRRCHGT